MKKILIVEDEQAYLKLLHDQLTQRSYEVYEATDGEEGLAMIEKEKPDMVLLDIRMPKMDGMDMLDRLRQTEGGKKTKVIILTNLEPDDKIISQVVDDQPTYYFVKSDTKLTDLMGKIEEVMAE